MGRKQAVDREKALAVATEHFWAYGYDAMSMRSLAESLDIHLGSLYYALGDKKQVFEKALRVYLENHAAPPVEALAKASSPWAALNEFLEKYAEECSNTKNTPGCFIINSLLEIAAISDNVTLLLHDHLAKIEDGFCQCIKSAVEKGEIPEKTNATQAARLIISSLFSMRAMEKLQAPTPYAQDIHRGILKALQAGI